MSCYFRGRLFICHQSTAASAAWLAFVSSLLHQIWALAFAGAIPGPSVGCEVWAQPPCHVSRAEILAPGSESCWVMQEDVRASSAFLVPALCRHHAGKWEAKTSCKCPFHLNLIGCGLSIRHFLKTLRSVPAALLHGQTGDDLRHELRRDGPPHCHHQPSSITTSSVDAERLKCS